MFRIMWEQESTRYYDFSLTIYWWSWIWPWPWRSYQSLIAMEKHNIWYPTFLRPIGTFALSCRLGTYESHCISFFIYEKYGSILMFTGCCISNKIFKYTWIKNYCANKISTFNGVSLHSSVYFPFFEKLFLPAPAERENPIPFLLRRLDTRTFFRIKGASGSERHQHSTQTACSPSQMCFCISAFLEDIRDDPGMTLSAFACRSHPNICEKIQHVST